MKTENVQQVHRPTSFKQINKSHKHGRHRSKGEVQASTKGKVSVKTLTKKKKKELNRIQRKHQAEQIREGKRGDILSKKRSIGSDFNPPFLICVLPLHQQLNPQAILSIITNSDEEAKVFMNATGVVHMHVPRFKQRFSFVIPPQDNELAILDTLKICDTVLFLVSAEGGTDFGAEFMDDWGSKILVSSFSQGLPTPVIAVTEFENLQPKKKINVKKNLEKIFSKWFPDDKLMYLSNNSDAINIIRKIGNQKRKNLHYRHKRPYLFAEKVEYIPNDQGVTGTLEISGYLRGFTLWPNNLIHIPGLGDFQMSQIDELLDPNPLNQKYNLPIGTEQILTQVSPDLEKQESLVSENIPDPLDAEQTWPTEEEMNIDDQSKKQKLVKKVPKGWSHYQSAWIPDVDTETVSDNESVSSTEMDYMDALSDNVDAEEEEKSEDEADFHSVTESEVAIDDQRYDEQMDFNAEKSDLVKLKEAKSDMMFPDEIDTPQDIFARERFQKYRGLESFRTSPWDPKENLPSDYARIFQFQNFDRTRRRILKECDDQISSGPGDFVKIYVKNVSQLLWSAFKSTNAPLVAIGLFPHEHKMSVLNVVLKRSPNYDIPIKSKERLIFQCGFRRFIVNPIFSQHTNGQKHKYERFFQPNSTTVATFFAPIHFPPAPVLCYKEINNNLILVATGNLLSVNPDRIILKRIVLSGHPFKVFKRSAVIRFMFFNREDIIYFKPIKLRTKMGRVGHIKEPLGTHGHMKCVFDSQLKSQDTVLLNLYKRVFPKWTYEECIVSCDNGDKMEL